MVFTNDESIIVNLEQIAPLGKSDHAIIKAGYRCLPEPMPPKVRNCYEKADFNRMRDMLNVNWEEIFTDCKDDVNAQIQIFLAEKNLDIEAKTFKDIFPVASGPDSEETTSKFLYAIVEILLDFINQTNDRDGQVLDFHHPSQITKAMDFTLPEQGLDLEQLVVDCRTALR